MDLSDSALRVLAELSMVKGAFLFGARHADTPLKLMAGSTSVSVPRPIVTELQETGCLSTAELGSEE